MKNAIIIGALGAAVSLSMITLGYVAGTNGGQEQTAAPVSAARASGVDQAGVEKIVRDYLLDNPELLTEMQAALETKQLEEQRVAQQQTIRNSADDIFNSQYDGIIGNPEGDVTVVEFFDYNCGFCKRALADMQALIDKDPQLRFVMKEFPILGPDSQKAHVVSMAFRSLMPEKYAEFHQRLLSSPGRAGEDSAMEIALSLGADESALRAEMEDPEIVRAFSETYELANALAITGTPSYVVGQEVVFGALGREVLAEKIATARN